MTTVHSQTHFILNSDIFFGNVLALREQGERWLQDSKATEISMDFKHVTRCDASALTLMLTFMRQAQELGKSLRFTNVPDFLEQIAQVCGVLSLLPINSHTNEKE